jgi:uncharacterized membrane protein
MASTPDDIQALQAQIAALTARIYELEQKAGITPQPPQQTTPAAPQQVASPIPQIPPPAPPPLAGVYGAGAPFMVPPPPRAPSPALSSPLGSSPDTAALEKKIGQYWLNRIGIAAILIGVAYFIKLAFDNNWIGPRGRISIGLIAGIALTLWSDRFRNRGYAAFSYSLKAVGIGTLYLSLWGAYQVYHLIPSSAAFVAMIVVTASTIALALGQNAELLAAFAVVGGFATPLLLSTGQNHEIVLFSYTALLDLALLTMAIARPWRRLLWGGFAGTLLLFIGWFSEYFSHDQRPLTIFFAALFAAIFAGIPLAVRHEQSKVFRGNPSATLTVLPVINVVVFFLALFAMYVPETVTLTWYALALAAIYLAISNAFKTSERTQYAVLLRFLHVAIAIAFLTIAIPLKLEAQLITIGWLVESAVLLWVSIAKKVQFLRYFAIVALILGLCRLLFFDHFEVHTLIFNARFATYLAAIAVLGGIAGFGRSRASRNEMPFIYIALVLLNILALNALTWEATDYFARQQGPGGYDFVWHQQKAIARDFSFSAIWLVYGAALMTIGFAKRSAFVRWQALILIGFTILKVFLYDLSNLGGSYRILSFIGLGAVLLAISFIYQRDWLKLSSRASADKSGPVT